MKTVLMVIGGIVVVFVVICVGLIAVASFSGTASTSRTPIVTKLTPGTTSGDEAPVASDQATVAQVGDRVELDGMAMTLVSVDRKEQLSEYEKAKDGKIFIVASVLIENVGKKDVSYNPFYFKMIDAEKFEYEKGIVSDDNRLTSGELSEGGKTKGTVVFEVPNDAKGLVLIHEPPFGSKIEFSLDQ